MEEGGGKAKKSQDFLRQNHAGYPLPGNRKSIAILAREVIL
jgi:hypothetical protein